LSKSVFISHAAKDKNLAKEIVDLIEDGMGVPEGEIFCSSLPGYGIPSGSHFVTYIKEQMLEPKVVVLLLTPAYFESKFCLSELGAAWIKSHEIFPILVPPLEHSDVKDVLLGTQVAKIGDDIKYNELKDKLIKALNFTPKSPTKWDVKRRSFLKAIKPILKKIEGPSHVSMADYSALGERLGEAQQELDNSETEIRTLKERLAATEALKDKAEVAALSAQFGNSDHAQKFEELTDEIASFRSVLKSAEVLKFALSDHYDKPYKINWMENREEFEAAARYDFIRGDQEQVDWTNYRMRSLKAALDKLDDFLSSNGKELRAAMGEDALLDPGNQEFWELHYKI